MGIWGKSLLGGGDRISKYKALTSKPTRVPGAQGKGEVVRDEVREGTGPGLSRPPK